MVHTEGGNDLTPEEKVNIRPIASEDYEAVYRLVSEGYIHRPEGWTRWALAESPVFRPDLSAVAELDGKVVGVWLATMNAFKVSEELLTPTVDSLVVVDPTYRRRRIGLALYTWGRQRAAVETTVRFGVATPENRERFWAQYSRAEPVRHQTMIFTKVISMSTIEKAATDAGGGGQREQGQGRGREGLTLLVDVLGVPRFGAKVDPTGIQVSDPDQVDPAEVDVTVRGEIRSRAYSSLLTSLLTGRLRVSGLREARRLLRYRGMLRRFMMNLLREPTTVI